MGSLFTPLWMKVFTLIALFSLLYHAWIGCGISGWITSRRCGHVCLCKRYCAVADRVRRVVSSDPVASVMMTTTTARRRFDAVIVGAGGAGMRCSLQLANAGLNVAVLSKVFPTRSHTVAAQGGIGASLGNMTEDNWLWHMFDTVKGSDYLGDQDAIEFMVPRGSRTLSRARAFRHALRSQCRRALFISVRSVVHSAHFGEKPVPRCVRRGRPPGHAMLHTLYQRNVASHPSFFVEWRRSI